jgi:hypothetical protein
MLRVLPAEVADQDAHDCAAVNVRRALKFDTRLRTTRGNQHLQAGAWWQLGSVLGAAGRQSSKVEAADLRHQGRSTSTPIHANTFSVIPALSVGAQAGSA